MVHVQIHYPEARTEGLTPFIQDVDHAHFVATFNRALRQSNSPDVAACDVYIGERTQDRYVQDSQGVSQLLQAGGWLEHTIVITYHAEPGARARSYTIGAIQRSIGVQSEFHS